MNTTQETKKYGIQKLALSTSNIHRLNPKDITQDPGWNVRVNTIELKEHIRTLADSIKEVGVLEPITVYMKDGEAILTNGHCRLEATLLAISEGANIESIKVQLEDRTATDADKVLMMLTRNSGKPLDLSERAKVIARLRKMGMSPQEVAKKTGYRQNHVDWLLKFTELASPEIYRMIKDGKVSSSVAVHTVIHEKEKATDVLKAGLLKAESEGKAKIRVKHLDTKPRDIFKPIIKTAEKIKETDLNKYHEIMVLTNKIKDLIG